MPQTLLTAVRTRRAILRTWAAAGAGFVLAACGLRPSETEPDRSLESTGASGDVATTAGDIAQPPAMPPADVAPSPTGPPAVALAPTPACGGDDDDPTPAQTEGPYFTPNSPERASLVEPGMSAARLVVSGDVVTPDCRPIAGALVDFWHCDDAGVYDNVGYRLRGHQFADADGRYRLETIMPGSYPGRTRHIHVKVQAPNQPVLTTQLYFPGEAHNASDGIFNPALVMDLSDTQDGKQGTFRFVLDV